ncbi:MAG: hypothetical protein EPN37_19200 [Chitinophagaceae bacterium]|nr:MAG: hypothetical protein EPN37_19200 [Chitinophagaceae bacterium]
MNDLPQPLTPADCDCRCVPVPFDMLVELLMSTFGFSSEAAIDAARKLAVDLPFQISEAGRA